MNDLLWYEIDAEAFRLCTGHMAPGKDAAPQTYPAPIEDRMQAWDEWQRENAAIRRAFRSAIAAMVPHDE